MATKHKKIFPKIKQVILVGPVLNSLGIKHLWHQHSIQAINTLKKHGYGIYSCHPNNTGLIKLCALLCNKFWKRCRDFVMPWNTVSANKIIQINLLLPFSQNIFLLGERGQSNFDPFKIMKLVFNSLFGNLGAMF